MRLNNKTMIAIDYSLVIDSQPFYGRPADLAKAVQSYTPSASEMEIDKRRSLESRDVERRVDGIG